MQFVVVYINACCINLFDSPLCCFNQIINIFFNNYVSPTLFICSFFFLGCLFQFALVFHVTDITVKDILLISLKSHWLLLLTAIQLKDWGTHAPLPSPPPP